MLLLRSSCRVSGVSDPYRRPILMDHRWIMRSGDDRRGQLMGPDQRPEACWSRAAGG